MTADLDLSAKRRLDPATGHESGCTLRGLTRRFAEGVISMLRAEGKPRHFRAALDIAEHRDSAKDVRTSRRIRVSSVARKR